MTVILDEPKCGTARNNHWRVVLLDEPDRMPGLVQFTMHTRTSKRLDQTAQWLAAEGRWAVGRWRPAPPIVPKWLIARVEAALLQGVGK